MMQPGDPLAELRDIHLPPPLDLTTLAPGWWVLIGLSLALILISIWLIYRRFRKKAYLRQAVRELEKVEQSFHADGRSDIYLMKMNEILKRVALASYPRIHVAPLAGEAWVSFLANTGKEPEFTTGAGELLIDGPYSGMEPLSRENQIRLQQLGIRWIRKHNKKQNTPVQGAPS